MNRRFKIILIFLIIFTTGAIIFLKSQLPLRPNVILISIDALRADHLGCYGYKRNTSPNIDSLAEEGLLFTQAIAQSSHTCPSIGTIITSTLPNKHLALTWGYSIRPDLPTLPAILKFKGYQTIFVSNNYFFSKGLHGFTKDFNIFYERTTDAIAITDKILQYIRNCIKRPFFLWVHYMDTHSPYCPLYPYSRLYINDELYDKKKRLPIVKDRLDIWNQYGYKGIPESLAKLKGGIDNPDYYIAKYDAAIRTIDELIGILLIELKELNIDNRTLIIITSDHGEMLGEHGYYFSHGWFLYEPLIKVPLLIKYNKIIPKNKVIKEQISAHLDMMPTILAILKIDKVKTMEGINLLPIILGEDKYPSPYVFSDEGESVKCIRSNEWKLICTNRENERGYQLYNLKEDPQELKNLVKVEKETFEFLRQKLDAYEQVNLQARGVEPVLDEETKRKLMSLGYAQ